MGWRVEMQAGGAWKVVPPADYSLNREEAAALARSYEEKGRTVRVVEGGAGARHGDPRGVVRAAAPAPGKTLVEVFAREAASEARHAADFPDLETALIGAQSKFDATHTARVGGQTFVYSTTSKGYQRRALFRRTGENQVHWSSPTLVADLPPGAHMIHQALTGKPWDPETMLPASPGPVQVAAEARKAPKFGEGLTYELATRPRGGTVIGVFKTLAEAKRVAEDREGQRLRWEKEEAKRERWETLYYSDREYTIRVLGIPPGRPDHPDYKAAEPRQFRRAPKHNPVEDAPRQDGSKVPWIKLVRDPQQHRERMADAKAIGDIKNAGDIYDLLSADLAKEDQETFCVVLLDIRGGLRGVCEVHRGERSRVGVGVPDILRVVLESGAEGFAVVHNHPTGLAEPSEADEDLTEAIRKGAEAADLVFVDHVVIGVDQYYSFTEKKLHERKGKNA